MLLLLELVVVVLLQVQLMLVVVFLPLMFILLVMPYLGTGGGSDEVKLIHAGDADTYLLYDANVVNLVAGGSSAIKLDLSTNKISNKQYKQ